MVEFIETTTFSVAVISTSGSRALRQAQEPPVEGLNERYIHYFWDSPLGKIKPRYFSGFILHFLISALYTSIVHSCHVRSFIFEESGT